MNQYDCLRMRVIYTISHKEWYKKDYAYNWIKKLKNYKVKEIFWNRMTQHNKLSETTELTVTRTASSETTDLTVTASSRIPDNF